MKLTLLASAWSFGSLERCWAHVSHGPFHGVEGPLPDSAEERARFAARLRSERVPWVCELVTGGDYAPASSVPFETHLAQLTHKLQQAAELQPLLVTCLAGSDSWPQAQALDFYGRALQVGERLGLVLSFETHRGRPTFNPWSTRDILTALPALRLTCDFSHWCVVSERLVDDEGALSLAIERALHIHARVGYAQGPQVPDPRAPEYQPELLAHERWWSRIVQAARGRGQLQQTITPEFGPDGYLHQLPFSRQPVADLDEINLWMAERLTGLFGAL